MNNKHAELRASLEQLPHISSTQVEQWVNLQSTIDKSRDYLVLAVPEAQASVELAQRILEQDTYTLVFFGGTGVGKSTLINSLLGRNLLPTGAVTAVTGTIVYIEQAEENESESLVLTYWEKDEFAERVVRLCELAQMSPFNITNDGERDLARTEIEGILEANREFAKTERDEYLEILLDCIDTYSNHKAIFTEDGPSFKQFPLSDETGLTHLREDGFKGDSNRQIRLIKSATFRIQPNPDAPNLLMNGYLRIVDVPGLGAGMRLHEEITLEEMKKKDAMIVLVTDAGRQRVDEMKSLSAVHWVKENRLFGLRGADLDDAAAKIFVVVNGANVRQAYDRLTADGEGGDREVREVLRHLAPNYWEKYKKRGRDGRSYFLVMTPTALYLQDPENAPGEFESESARILSAFGDLLPNFGDDPDLNDPAVREALMALSEVPQLRDRLVSFIQNERVQTQLREASTRVRQAIGDLRHHYQTELAQRGVYPPFKVSWETLQQKRYENRLRQLQKDLPRLFHNALLDLSNRTNSDSRFRSMLAPSLGRVKASVEDSIKREIDELLDSYGTEYWDDRDVTYDNLVWGTSGIELPIKRILYQVEIEMQQAVSRYMPAIADVISTELQRTLETHEIQHRLAKAEYGQGYQYLLTEAAGESFEIDAALKRLVDVAAAKFRQVCEHATMYELMKPERSVYNKLETAESLALPTNERILDIALNGTGAVRDELAAAAEAAGAISNGTVPSASAPSAPAEAAPAPDDEFVINILDEPVQPAAPIDLDVPYNPDAVAVKGLAPEPLEMSYADRLDNVADKAKVLFGQIIDDLFRDDELLPRLRRLFWMEATRIEQSFNNEIIKPMLRNHDRNLNQEELLQAMEPDLESVSDIEGMMRIWEGLNELEEDMLV